MPINLRTESVISLSEAARHLPRLRQGRKVHVGTLYRWISRGVGGVRLEAVKIGRTLVTSREALQRFADRSSAVQRSSRVKRTRDENDRTESELDGYGL